MLLERQILVKDYLLLINLNIAKAGRMGVTHHFIETIIFVGLHKI